MNNVVLLNADYSVLGIIHWRKAIKLIAKKKVDIVKSSNVVICNFEKTISLLIPEVIRLIKFVRSIWKNKVPFNKRNLFIRDNFTCQYCGKKIDKDGSIDHVIPKSKGGASTYDNCVTSCIICNNKKDNRSCKEAKMYPLNRPVTPTINQFLLTQIKNTGLFKTLEEFGII